MIISIFTPHGGCPERCVFCDQKTSGGTAVSAAHVSSMIESHLSTQETADEIAFYGGTFTGMPEHIQLRYFEAAKPYLASGKITDGIRISTRPDACDPLWLERLKNLGLKTVELGVQSFHPESLKMLGRTHSVSDATDATVILRQLDLKIGLHLMLGCPGERDDEDEHTLEALTRLKPDYVRIHPLLVIKGTALEATYEYGAFSPIALEPAIQRAAWLTERIEGQGMRVIRLGLQPNELLGEAVVAGAYHPSFGDLVRSRIVRNRIENALQTLDIPPGSHLDLTVPRRKESQLKGHRSETLEWLRKTYQFTQIVINTRHAESNDFKAEFPFGEIWLRYPSGLTERRQIELS